MTMGMNEWCAINAHEGIPKTAALKVRNIYHGVTFFILLSCIVCPSVLAGPKNSAKKLFKQGTSAFDAGQYEEAATKFRAANEANYNWKLFYNIGQAEAAAGNNGRALEAFEIYMTKGSDSIPIIRQDDVLKEMERLRSITGSIDIVAPDDCHVFVDGVERGITPLPGSILVNAGVTLQLQVVQNGEEIFSRNIRVNGAQVKRVSIYEDSKSETEPIVAPVAEQGEDDTKDDALEAASVTNASETDSSMNMVDAEQPTKARKMKIAGLVVLSAGGAALIAGGVTGGLAIKRKNDMLDECGDDATAACSQTSDRNLKDSRTLGNISTAAFIAGGVLAATGVTLFILGKRQESLIAAQPIATPEYAGINFTGHF